MQVRRITIRSFATSAEAHLAKGLLEAHGIDATLVDDVVVALAWHLSSALGGVKLQVPAQDAEVALRLLGVQPRSLPEEEFDSESESAPQSPISPADQAAKRAWVAAVMGLAILPLSLYSLYLLAGLVRSHAALSARGKRQALWALLFNIVVLVGMASYFA